MVKVSILLKLYSVKIYLAVQLHLLVVTNFDAGSKQTSIERVGLIALPLRPVAFSFGNHLTKML